MQNKFILSILILLAIAITAFGIYRFRKSDNKIITPLGYELVSFETLKKDSGASSTISTKQNLVIKDQDKLEFLVKNTDMKEFPKIDFTKEMVIVAFQGQKPSGGYTIEIIQIKNMDNKIEVSVKSSNPGGNCMGASVITHPYHIVKLAKSDKEIIFKETEVTTSCNLADK